MESTWYKTPYLESRQLSDIMESDLNVCLDLFILLLLHYQFLKSYPFVVTLPINRPVSVHLDLLLLPFVSLYFLTLWLCLHVPDSDQKPPFVLMIVLATLLGLFPQKFFLNMIFKKIQLLCQAQITITNQKVHWEAEMTLHRKPSGFKDSAHRG